MDPENPATEVEQLRSYARMCSILEHIYKIRVVVLNAAFNLYLNNIQMQVVIKKSQDIFKRFLRHFIS